MTRARAILLATLLTLAAPALAGCLDRPEPGRSIPLETIAPRPPPMGVGQVVLVEFDLEEFHVATRFNGTWREDLGAAALADMGYVPTDEGDWVQQPPADDRGTSTQSAASGASDPRDPSDASDGDEAGEARAQATRVAVEPAEDGGFWFNVTYPGVELNAPDEREAAMRADEAWREREPHLLGTLAAFEHRTGWKPEGASSVTYTLSAGWRPSP